MLFGRGALPDIADRRDTEYLASDLVGGVAVPTRAMGLLDHVYIPAFLGVFNQLHTSQCVGYGVVQTIATYTHAAYGKHLVGSPLATVFHASAKAMGWDRVRDIGCSPRLAWNSIRDLGLVPFEKWPRRADVRNWHDVAEYVAKPPDPDCYRESVDLDWIRYHWIMTRGEERKRECCQSLASGRPFALSLSLDDTFDLWTPSSPPWKRAWPINGHHYVTAVGYEPQGLWVMNSWGSEWGHLGFGLVSWDTVMSPETRSLAIPDIAEGAL